MKIDEKKSAMDTFKRRMARHLHDVRTVVREYGLCSDAAQIITYMSPEVDRMWGEFMLEFMEHAADGYHILPRKDSSALNTGVWAFIRRGEGSVNLVWIRDDHVCWHSEKQFVVYPKTYFAHISDGVWPIRDGLLPIPSRAMMINIEDC